MAKYNINDIVFLTEESGSVSKGAKGKIKRILPITGEGGDQYYLVDFEKYNENIVPEKVLSSEPVENETPLTQNNTNAKFLKIPEQYEAIGIPKFPLNVGLSNMVEKSQFNWVLVAILTALGGVIVFSMNTLTPDKKPVLYASLICFAITLLYIIIRDARIQGSTLSNGKNNSESSQNRTFLMIWVVTVGLLIIVVFGMFVYYSVDVNDKDDRLEAAKWIFTGTIPLIASWIGTVLAFYFGRENFEAAAKQVLGFTREELDDIAVGNMMISYKSIFALKIDDEGKVIHPVTADDTTPLTVKQVIELFKNLNKDRIPIFTVTQQPKYIIHLSTLEVLPDKEQGKSLVAYLESQKDKYRYMQEKGFIVVSREISLQDAIAQRVKSLSSSKDIFVTDNGNESGKIIGWVTDTLSNRFLNVKVRKE